MKLQVRSEMKKGSTAREKEAENDSNIADAGSWLTLEKRKSCSELLTAVQRGSFTMVAKASRRILRGK